jgi:hypothetical protein
MDFDSDSGDETPQRKYSNKHGMSNDNPKNESRRVKLIGPERERICEMVRNFSGLESDPLWAIQRSKIEGSWKGRLLEEKQEQEKKDENEEERQVIKAVLTKFAAKVIKSREWVLEADNPWAALKTQREHAVHDIMRHWIVIAFIEFRKHSRIRNLFDWLNLQKAIIESDKTDGQGVRRLVLRLKYGVYTKLRKDTRVSLARVIRCAREPEAITEEDAADEFGNDANTKKAPEVHDCLSCIQGKSASKKLARRVHIFKEHWLRAVPLERIATKLRISPEQCQAELKTLYEMMRQQCPRLREKFEKLLKSSFDDDSDGDGSDGV